MAHCGLIPKAYPWYPFGAGGVNGAASWNGSRREREAARIVKAVSPYIEDLKKAPQDLIQALVDLVRRNELEWKTPWRTSL